MSVLAIAEQRDGEFRKVTYEAISEGRRIADELGTDLAAVVLGSGIEGAAGDLGKYGADKVLVADSPAQYAGALLSLMNDSARREHYAQAGRDRALSHHNWPASMRRLDTIIEHCLQRSAMSEKEATLCD